MSWMWLVGGVIVGLWFWRLSFRVLWEDSKPYRDGADLLVSLVMATVCFWAIGPGVVLLSVFRCVLGDFDWESVGRVLAGESRADKLERREREVIALERENRQLERELEIDTD